MANFKRTIITKKGQAFIAKLEAGTAKAGFKKICTSDYDYSSLNNAQLEELTAISNIKQTIIPNQVDVVNAYNVKVRGILTNTDLTSGYYIRTIALYATDPDEGEILYSITPSTLSDYIPPNNGVTSSGVIIDLLATVGNSENVSIEVNPNATVTITEFNNFKDDVNSQLNENTKKPVTFISDKIMKATSNLNIKIIGDSITCGNGGTGYATDGETIYGSFKVNTNGHCWANSLKAYLEANYNCSVKNWGCGGTTSTDMVNHLSDLIKSTDDIIICAIGTNNRRVTDGLNVLYNDVNTIYSYVKNLGKDIVFATNIPSTETSQLFTHEQINSVIKRFSRDNKIEVINFFDEFVTNGVNIYGLNTLLSDGTHPCDKGYDLMYSAIMKELGFPCFIDFGKQVLNTDDDLNNCWGYETEYYTPTDSVAKTILNKPTDVTTSFNVKNVRCIKNTSYAVYSVQEITTMKGDKYIRTNIEGVISDWNRIITADLLNKVELLSAGTYNAGTALTFDDNVNNYNCLIIAYGSHDATDMLMQTIRLSKVFDFYNSEAENVWAVGDGYIKFTSTTTANIVNTSKPIRRIFGIKGVM